MLIKDVGNGAEDVFGSKKNRLKGGLNEKKMISVYLNTSVEGHRHQITKIIDDCMPAIVAISAIPKMATGALTNAETSIKTAHCFIFGKPMVWHHRVGARRLWLRKDLNE